MIKPGPQKVTVDLTADERARLLRLHHTDGAWTRQELNDNFALGRVIQLERQNILGTIQTPLGYMTFLLAEGRIAVLGRSVGGPRLSTQLDRAYLRLALRQLDWPVSASQALAEAYGQEGMTQVDTPEGPALVLATLGTGQGYSAAGIRRVIPRQRSNALFHGYSVIILTPSPRRGQKAVAKESDWIQVRPILPRSTPHSRLQISQGWDEYLPPQPGPFLTPEALPLVAANLPGWSQQTLLLSRRERIERAVHDLAFDLVMSAAQLQRHYALQPEDLEGIPYVEDFITPINSAMAQEYRMRFFLAKKRQRYWSGPALGHHAATGEMRRLQHIPADPSRWSLGGRGKAAGRLKYEEPDAIAHSSYGDVPQEYDTGSYTMSKIETKLETYRDRGFLQPYWGVPSARRARRLKALIPANLLLVDWFR
ncbi:hypothetical protein [Deinococcus navajonensis]|uniref:Uncharacterized protein n=1 Tax=Deinococcus navajonensis TaxID=309884 RepID=A0ABV8XK38_9DEIO